MINLKKLTVILAGYMMLGLGILGMFVPLLPTTCFLILAVWCFSKTNPELSNMILENPEYGPAIKDWINYRTIQAHTKCIISASIVMGFSISIILLQPGYLLNTVLFLIMLSLLCYINTRPELPLQKNSPRLIN